jgi:hypothetical protein
MLKIMPQPLPVLCREPYLQVLALNATQKIGNRSAVSLIPISLLPITTAGSLTQSGEVSSGCLVSFSMTSQTAT